METLRCSAAARANGDDPVGSAAVAPGGFLLVEVAPPWPPSIEDLPGIAALVAHASARQVRVLLVSDAGRPRPSDPAVVLYGRAGGDGRYGPYRRTEVTATPATRADAARALLDGDPGAGEATRDRVDVLVCTHGRRDVCCGGDGTRLHDELGRRLRALGPVRLWRSSHQGGHRFAPTMLVLPDGTSWGHLDAPMAEGIVRRSVPTDRAAPHLRGTTSLPSGGAMLLDRIALADTGWSWCDAERLVTIGTGGHVQVGSGDGPTWSGTVDQVELPALTSCRDAPVTKLTGSWRLQP